MVNFRYHLVSLIAVFTALAIGVILGAGPLQARIAAVSTAGESQTLTSADLTRIQAQADAEAAGVRSIADQLLPGKLDGVKVVVVSLPGAAATDVSVVRDDLEKAGATVVGAATLTSNWDSEQMATYRRTLATPIESHLTRSMDADVTPDGIVAFGVVEVLTTTGAERDLLQEILTNESTPIVTIEEDPEGQAQAAVLVGASAQESAAGSADVPSLAAWVGAARAFSTLPQGAVMLADASIETALMAQLRTQGSPITTVDSVGTAVASLSTSLALTKATTEAVAYGSGIGAQKPMPTFE